MFSSILLISFDWRLEPFGFEVDLLLNVLLEMSSVAVIGLTRNVTEDHLKEILSKWGTVGSVKFFVSLYLFYFILFFFFCFLFCVSHCSVCVEGSSCRRFEL